MPVNGSGASTRVYALESTPGYDASAGVVGNTGRNLDVAMRGNAWLAVQGLLGLGKPGLIALVGAAKQIVAFGQANPTAPTIKQEAALLSIIKEALTPPAQPGEGQPTALTNALKAATAAVASAK